MSACPERNNLDILVACETETETILSTLQDKQPNGNSLFQDSANHLPSDDNNWETFFTNYFKHTNT